VHMATTACASSRLLCSALGNFFDLVNLHYGALFENTAHHIVLQLVARDALGGLITEHSMHTAACNRHCAKRKF
jgi:hypothetical protein